jgi:hypothetical protein
MVLPPVVLFLANMAGCVGSILSHGSIGKKRLKAILNLNKLMEIVLMMYNVMRLIFVPSKLVMREVYVGRTLSNFLFLVQCQLFTKVTWNVAKPSLEQPNVGHTMYGSRSRVDGEFQDGSDSSSSQYGYGNHNQRYKNHNEKDYGYPQYAQYENDEQPNDEWS